jgi:antitoxin VapB
MQSARETVEPFRHLSVRRGNSAANQRPRALLSLRGLSWTLRGVCSLLVARRIVSQERLTGAGRRSDQSAILLCSNVSTRGDPMPLNIRSEETEELASALAKLTGETKTEAVTQALRERIQRVRRARAKRRLADELDEIALHCSTLPVLDRRSADEIMDYDENGLPR